MGRKPTLSADHVNAIGEMVVSMTRLESVVVDLLAIFMESPSVLHTVTAFSHQQMSSNIDTLCALYSLGYEKEALKDDKGLTLFRQARELADFRNSVVHAHWTTDTDGTVLAVRYQARGHFKRTRTPMSAATILARAREADKLAELLRDLRDHLHAEGKPAK